MKVVARVRFEDPQNRELLVQEFYGQEYSPQNKLIVLNDEAAVVELWFEKEPPQSIIKAISHCKIDAMYNQDEVEELPKTEIEVLDVPSAHTDPDDGTKESIKPPKQDTKPQEPPKAKKKKDDDKKKLKRRYGKQKPSEDDYLDIPEFEALAKKATSFSDVVEAASTWLGLTEEDSKYFSRLMSELATLDIKPYEISDDDVKKANLNISHQEHKRFQFGKTVRALLEKKDIYATILPFIYTVMKYAKQANETNSATPNKRDTSEDADDYNHHAEEEQTKIEPEEVKGDEESCYMQCDDFVAILERIDKDLPINDKLKKLLSEMGLERKSKILYKNACLIADAAFRMETLESIDDVMLNAGLDTSTRDGLQTKVKFSEWINEYNKANDVKRMKVIGFLRELKKIFRN